MPPSMVGETWLRGVSMQERKFESGVQPSKMGHLADVLYLAAS
jgi:hypothetical protein